MSRDSSLWCQTVGLQCVIVVFPDHTHLLLYVLFVVDHYSYALIVCSGSVYGPCLLCTTFLLHIDFY